MKSQVLQIANKLRRQGYEITLYKRKDRGYLIKSINGRRFTGAKGNQFARSLTGSKLSNKVLQANRRIVEKYIVKPKLPKSFMKEFQKTQRIWRTRSPKVSGKISMKDFRWRIEHKGMEEAIRSLHEHQRYAKGLAYNENINTFISQLENRASHSTSIHKEQTQKIIDWMDKNRNKITEEQMGKAFQLIYKSEKGDMVDFDTGIKQVAQLFGIDI